MVQITHNLNGTQVSHMFDMHVQKQKTGVESNHACPTM